jgi:hypothetical protein
VAIPGNSGKRQLHLFGAVFLEPAGAIGVDEQGFYGALEGARREEGHSGSTLAGSKAEARHIAQGPT